MLSLGSTRLLSRRFLKVENVHTEFSAEIDCPIEHLAFDHAAFGMVGLWWVIEGQANFTKQ
jgi:hypothetical protein